MLRPTYEQVEHLPNNVTDMNQEQRREMLRLYLDCWKNAYEVTTDREAIQAAKDDRRTRLRWAAGALNQAAPLRKWLLERSALRPLHLPPTPLGVYDQWDAIVSFMNEDPVVRAVFEKYDSLRRAAQGHHNMIRNNFGYVFDHLLPGIKGDPFKYPALKLGKGYVEIDINKADEVPQEF